MPRITEPSSTEQGTESLLDQVLREGAQKLLLQALEAEVEDYLQRHRSERDEKNHARVVRHGHGQARKLLTGVGTLEVRAPRVRDKRVDEQGRPKRFVSQILPPYMRTSPKVEEVLPLLYLRGLSTGDFRPALDSLLGPHAAGLSPTSIARMTEVWEEEYQRFMKQDLSRKQYVYMWADGIHLSIRLEEERLCVLVLIGVTSEGTKEVVAVCDGYRESAESWSEVLRDVKQRGLPAPKVVVGDGALGCWKACREVWPTAREQRCWVHKLANVLDKFPKRSQPKAKDLLRNIMYAETREDAEREMALFGKTYQAKFPKAVECLEKDRDTLFTFFEFPAEHWTHLRTTNVIESPFATVRARERVTHGVGCRRKGLTMAFKLLDMAQLRWKRLNGCELLPLVWAGVRFVDGVQASEPPRSSPHKTSHPEFQLQPQPSSQPCAA